MQGFVIGVSGERIWLELKKILTGRLTAPIFRQMINLGLGQYIGEKIIVHNVCC